MNRRVNVIIMIFLSWWGGLTASAEDSFLKPKEAFIPYVEIIDKKLHVDWQIAKGYFLYKHGFKVEMRHTSSDKTVQTLKHDFSKGIIKFDEYFERDVEIYYDHVAEISSGVITLPKQNFKLVLISQGCAENSICFPPTSYFFDVTAQGKITHNSEYSVGVTPKTNKESIIQQEEQ